MTMRGVCVAVLAGTFGWLISGASGQVIGGKPRAGNSSAGTGTYATESPAPSPAAERTPEKKSKHKGKNKSSSEANGSEKEKKTKNQPTEEASPVTSPAASPQG